MSSSAGLGMLLNLSLLLLSSAVAASAVSASSSPLLNFSDWDTVVRDCVSTKGSVHSIDLNTVDYAKVGSEKYKLLLDKFTGAVAGLNPADVDNLVHNKSQFYAFFINVYNAFAVKTIVENPCQVDLFGQCSAITSIRDVAYGFWPWEFGVWTRTAGQIAGKSWSLDEVEMHLRQPPSPLEEDSRLHAAIVCASVSCPNLRPSAYTWENIDEELTSNFNNFMDNNKKGMEIDTSKKLVTLSPIFKWFEADFKPSPLKFILSVLDKNHEDYSWLKENVDSATVEYFGYDWDVNAEKGDIPCELKAQRPCFRAWHLVLTVTIVAVVALMIALAVCISRRCRRHKDGYHRV